MRWLLVLLLVSTAQAGVDVQVPLGESAFEWKAMVGEAAGWMGRVDGSVAMAPAPGGWRLTVTRPAGQSLAVDVAAPSSDAERQDIAVLAVSLLQGGFGDLDEGATAEPEPAAFAPAPESPTPEPAPAPESPTPDSPTPDSPSPDPESPSPDPESPSPDPDPAAASTSPQPDPDPAAAPDPDDDLEPDDAPDPDDDLDPDDDPDPDFVFPDASAIRLGPERPRPWQRPVRPFLSVEGGASILLVARPNASGAFGFSGGLIVGPGLRPLLSGRVTLPPIRPGTDRTGAVGGEVSGGLGWSSDDRIAPLLGLRLGVGFDAVPDFTRLDPRGTPALRRVARPLLAIDAGASFRLAGPLRLDPFATLTVLPPGPLELRAPTAVKVILGVKGTLVPLSPRPFRLRQNR